MKKRNRRGGKKAEVGEKVIKFVSFCVQSGISRYFCVVSIEGPELKCVKMMWFWVST